MNLAATLDFKPFAVSLNCQLTTDLNRLDNVVLRQNMHAARFVFGNYRRNFFANIARQILYR